MIINGCSSEYTGNIFKFFGHTIRSDGLEKLITRGKVNGRRRKKTMFKLINIDRIKLRTGLTLEKLTKATFNRAPRFRKMTVQC